MYVADGIINLVEIFLILVARSHSLQFRYHLPGVVGCQYLGHGDAGIELQFVRRIETDDMLEGTVGILGMSLLCFYLSHQIPEAGFLLASHLIADGFAEIRNGLLIASGLQIVEGIGLVPFLLGTPVDGIALDITDYIFGIVYPSRFEITLGEPGTCLAVNAGLGGVETAHIGECSCCRLEIAFKKLGTAHQHPCLPEEWIIFTAMQPFQVFGCLAAFLVPYRAALDAMLVNGFLAFLDGAVVVRLAQFAAVLVANRIIRNHFRVIVLISVFLFERAFDIGYGTIIIGVVSGVEGMPPSALRRILLRRASCYGHCKGKDNHSWQEVSEWEMLQHKFLLYFKIFLSERVKALVLSGCQYLCCCKQDDADEDDGCT